jgi:hypothetical protein
VLLLDDISRDRSRSKIKFKTIIYVRYTRHAFRNMLPGCPCMYVCVHNNLRICVYYSGICLCGNHILLYFIFIHVSRLIDECGPVNII